MHLREICNRVTQQTSKSHVAEVSSKGKLVAYDACFMFRDKRVACFVTGFYQQNKFRPCWQLCQRRFCLPVLMKKGRKAE